MRLRHARAGRHGDRDAPGDRDVWKVVLARLISSSGVEAAFFIGLWGKAAYVFDGTATDLAIMSALIGLAAIVGSLIGGMLVDRFDARRVTLWTEVVVMPSSLALVLADTMTKLLLIGVVSWMAGAALEAAITSLPPALVDEDRLEQANARLESANWLSLVAGPGIGAALAGVYGIDSVFVLDALTSLAAIGFIARIRLDPRRAAAEAHAADASPDAPGSGLRDITDGLRYAWRTLPVRLALYLQALVGVAFGIFIALEPLYYRDVLQTGIEALGYINVVFGLGLFAGSVMLERTRGRLTGFRADILLSMAAGAGSVCYAGTDDLRFVVLGAVLWSVPLGMVLPMSRTLAQRDTAPAYVGRVMGALGMVAAGAGVLPTIFAPALASLFGVQLVLVGSGGAAVILAPLIWRVAARLDRERAGRPTPADATQVAAPAAGSSHPIVGMPYDPVFGSAPFEAAESAPEEA